MRTCDYYLHKAKKNGLTLSILIEQDCGTFQAGFKIGTIHLRLGYGTTANVALKKSLDSSLAEKERLEKTGFLKRPKAKRKRVRL